MFRLVFVDWVFGVALAIVSFYPSVAETKPEKFLLNYSPTEAKLTAGPSFSRSPLALGEFIQNGVGYSGFSTGFEVTCDSKSGILEFGENGQFATFLRSALVSELSRLGLYSFNSKFVLSGKVENPEVYLSQIFIADGQFQGDISLTLSLLSSDGKHLSIKTNHTFNLSNRMSFCRELFNQLGPAVTKLIETVLMSSELTSS